MKELIKKYFAIGVGLSLGFAAVMFAMFVALAILS